MNDPALREQDLALLSVLQIAPRISWAEAARILETTPSTLAARWARIRDEGIAWITAYPGGKFDNVTVAFVEIDCVQGARTDVVEALCADPRAVTVDESAHGRDIFLTVMTADFASFTSFVLDDLSRIPGVERQRSHLASAVHHEGRDWRLDGLSRSQRMAAEQTTISSKATYGVTPPPEAWPLINSLAKDGRRTAAELARETGRKPDTVRRQLARLIASGTLSFRCDVAQGLSDWPISCTWIVKVSGRDHNRTIAAIRALPELRLCITVAGSGNMVLTAWTRSLAHLLRLEGLLAEKLPWVNFVDGTVTLRTRKRMGWLLHPDGRCTGQVVVPSAFQPITE